MATKAQPNLLDLGDTSYVFVERSRVPHYLTCIICLGLLERSVATNCCTKMMCESHWLKEKGSRSRACPNCRHRLYTVSYNGAIDGIIKGLQVYCKHQDAGCDWKGDLSSEEDHRKADSGCQFEHIPCKNKCGEKIKRNDMKIHLLDECPLRPSLCKYCSFSGSQEEVDNHTELCPSHPVACPNGCSQDASFLRKDLKMHLDVCPEKEFVCTFATGGCPVKLKKADMEEHMRTNLEQHLVCLFKQNCQLKEETELLKVGEDRLKGEVQVLHQECHDLKLKVETLQMENAQLVAKYEDTKEQLDKLQDGEIKDIKLLMSNCLTWSNHLLYTTQSNDAVLPATFVYDCFQHDKDNDSSLISPSFYTSTEGYRLYFTVVPNGHGFARNKCLSILFSVLPGKFDEDLSWPFEGELNISILNQIENANHHSVEIDFCLFPPEQFARVYDEVYPVDQVMGWGILQFIKHEKLYSQDPCYLANDTLYFRVSLLDEVGPGDDDDNTVD